MNQNLTELVFILDKSGSMSGLESDTIGGFNSMLQKQQAVEGDCLITTVLFDNDYELLHDRTDIRAIKPITEKEYFIGGSTALLDAMGKTINKIAKAQRHTAEDYRPGKVLFVIITDGEENSSREYTAKNVKALVEQKKTEDSWEFIFMGANIDAVETAQSFGIAKDRAVDYLADSDGTELNYAVVNKVVHSLRSFGSIAPDAFNEINEDVKKRKNNNKTKNPGRKTNRDMPRNGNGN